MHREGGALLSGHDHCGRGRDRARRIHGIDIVLPANVTVRRIQGGRRPGERGPRVRVRWQVRVDGDLVAEYAQHEAASSAMLRAWCRATEAAGMAEAEALGRIRDRIENDAHARKCGRED